MNHRIGWARLPLHVRAGVEGILGGSVVSAVSQPGGFSPGSADRVVLASGRRAFVKAVSADVNATSAALHRREARISAAMDPQSEDELYRRFVDQATGSNSMVSVLVSHHFPPCAWRMRLW